jgi:hypothetical protein
MRFITWDLKSNALVLELLEVGNIPARSSTILFAKNCIQFATAARKHLSARGRRKTTETSEILFNVPNFELSSFQSLYKKLMDAHCITHKAWYVHRGSST